MNPFCDFLLAHYGYRSAMLVTTVVYAVLSLGGFFVEERSPLRPPFIPSFNILLLLMAMLF